MHIANEFILLFIRTFITIISSLCLCNIFYESLFIFTSLELPINPENLALNVGSTNDFRVKLILPTRNLRPRGEKMSFYHPMV